MKTIASQNNHRISRYTAAMNDTLSDLRLDFLGGKRLADVDIFIESNATVRKVRRIMEKRICQRYWEKHDGTFNGNRDRQRMRRRLTNHMIDIYGGVPEGFHYCA